RGRESPLHVERVAPSGRQRECAGSKGSERHGEIGMKEVTPGRRLPARIAKGFGLSVLALFVLGVNIWGALLLAFAGLGNDLVRGAVVSAFCLASAGALI